LGGRSSPIFALPSLLCQILTIEVLLGQAGRRWQNRLGRCRSDPQGQRPGPSHQHLLEGRRRQSGSPSPAPTLLQSPQPLPRHLHPRLHRYPKRAPLPAHRQGADSREAGCPHMRPPTHAHLDRREPPPVYHRGRLQRSRRAVEARHPGDASRARCPDGGLPGRPV
jgi:hypothetical protein